jgi:hypothetical protein
MTECRAVKVDYTNHRGERAVRRIAPLMGSLRFAATEWHPEPQWVFDAIDLEKHAERTFALSGIHSWEPIAVDA